MKDIQYTIEFYSNWHCGSGLAAGADMDLLVVKDSAGLPFVPGKTMKGLVRETAELLLQLKKDGCNQTNLQKCFGSPERKKIKNDGYVFFSNAELSDQEKQVIVNKKLQEFMFQSKSSTAIDDNGIADSLTLRKIQTTVPCKLYGVIKNVDDELVPYLVDSLKMIKRLGLNRNRGLGRCTISVMEEKGGIV